MKLLIASDIHGDADATKKLFEAFEREKADKLLLLGDLLYHGPRNNLPAHYAPKEVIECLNAHKDILLCVRGNCDAEVDSMVLSFPIRADYAFLSLDGITVFATHGHLFTHHECALKKGDCFLQGHTHIPQIQMTDDGILLLNPGSVSLPKNNAPATYMLFDEGSFILKTIDGRVYPVTSKNKE